jgi:hypothetical protein
MFVFMCVRAWLHLFQTAFKTKSAKCESQRRLSVVLVNAKALIKARVIRAKLFALARTGRVWFWFQRNRNRPIKRTDSQRKRSSPPAGYLLSRAHHKKVITNKLSGARQTTHLYLPGARHKSHLQRIYRVIYPRERRARHLPASVFFWPFFRLRLQGNCVARAFRSRACRNPRDGVLQMRGSPRIGTVSHQTL